MTDQANLPDQTANGVAAEDPITEGTIAEGTIAEGTIAEDPVTEDAVTESPVTEDPITEETVEDAVSSETTAPETDLLEEPQLEPSGVEESDLANGDVGQADPGEPASDTSADEPPAPGQTEDTTADDPPVPAAPSPIQQEPTLEMRQVAGLTAGSVMVLQKGSFQFRESEKDIDFSLAVEGVDQVMVLAGTAPAIVDEIPVEDPVPLGQSVLNVGSACFTVREPRQAPSSEARLRELETIRRTPPAIAVPDLEQQAPAPTQAKSSRFGSLFSKKLEDEGPELDAASWQFLESIRDARNAAAERQRWLHPNPEEIHSRLSRMDPGLWDRTVNHPLFARFAVAYSTIPWAPRFDEPERIPESLFDPIEEMSCLPWVPITANLLFGPLGIVGSRQASLACARNAVLSLASLTSPADIEFSIVTAQGLVSDWNWTSSLPNSLFPTGSKKYCVAVADGMVHFDGAGFTHDAVRNSEMGLVVLADSVDQLPDYCGTVLELMENGQCRVTNHLGEQVTGTPIGVAANFAAATAAMIKDALGDGPPEDELELEIGSPPDENGEPEDSQLHDGEVHDSEVHDGEPPDAELEDSEVNGGDVDHSNPEDAVEFETEDPQEPEGAGEAADPNADDPQVDSR